MADGNAQILDALDAISQKLDEVSSSIGTADDFTLAQQLAQQNEAINEQLTSLAAASNTLLDGNVDYSDGIDRLCTLLGYSDVLLMLLLVFIAVAMGIYVGTIVTNWLKTRG